MFRSSRRRTTILFLLALALVGPWTAAAEAADRAGSALLQPWDIAAQIWNALVGLWDESGCSLDPNGACGAGSQAESGCTVDPSGRCGGGGGETTATTGDHGCSADPNGGCGH
jgi:hypothetical protein